uniref:transposase n=1 Tax=Pseudomonas saliphila TaxID=2586906 RepID=UPI0038B4B8CE
MAISNARLRQVDEHSVTFSYKDYRQDAPARQMTLSGDEFVRRFLLHILPKGLMRVRHYGFLANRCRRARLEQLRPALRAGDAEHKENRVGAAVSPPNLVCSQCKRPHMYCIGIIAPNRVQGTGRLRRC